MKRFKFVLFSAVAGILLTVPQARAGQISVTIGAPPVCPYGYFDYAPYRCAPYGYYGPEWFRGGVFIGAGPWFHGREHFRGHIDNHFDPHYGYRGEYPHRGDRADRHPDRNREFRGRDMREEHPHHHD
ncbi:MAG TPA: hypothetical protein VKR52_16815 [Terracidiphilus sp.]|nr:hypothetical protein [Terracidiphilus sp.]